MSWSGRKSEEGRQASNVATSQNGSQAGGAAGTGGGIFSFLKTELDSFVKGLSGKADCLHQPDAPARSTANPPRKKLKRSHEPKNDYPSYAELKAYERELDEIRQHTSKRFTDQDYYAPLTEANLHASTSKLHEQEGTSSTSIKRDRRSQETRELVEAYSSYYTEEPVPGVPSAYMNRPASVSDVAENRRRKRERAATFVNDEEARQAVARQIADEEARLKAAEARAIEHRRLREREARDAKKRQHREDTLARLEAQQLREDVQKLQQIAAGREHQAHAEQAGQVYEEERRIKFAEHEQRRRVAKQGQKEREARDEEAAALRRQQQQREEEQAVFNRHVEQTRQQEEKDKADKAREEQSRRLRQQQRENARRTRDLENAEKERTQAIKDASESQRIQELEAEVQRLRRELEEAKRKQEEAAALSASTSRHVHFAPTPPASDGHRGEQSMLSINSASSNSLYSLSRAPPPPAPPPPPPPPAAPPRPSSLKAAKPSPLALLAAHKATSKTSDTAGKKRPSGINAAVGMPADMGKFLNEMKNTKLRKVGLPVEGAKKSKDEEESGLKSILEGVLKKRFLGDRTSGSTRTSSIPTLSNSNNSRLSISTTDSLTSFSSYRPPDWSMEIDSSPFPPLRSTSLPKRQQDSPVTAPEASSSVLPVHQQPSTAGSSGLIRTKSQPRVKMNAMHTDSPGPGLRRSQSLAKVHARPLASFGHAITCEEVAPPQRQRTQVYVSSHHRQSSQSTPLPKAPESSRHRQESVSMTNPSTAATARTRQSSDNTMTGRSVRSAGSSFDIELYTQMQLQEDNDSLEEEMKRSLSNPPAVDGTMDFASPQPRYQIAEASSSGERLKTRSHYQIPELTFRQPNFSFSPNLDLPAPRPQLEGGRKVSYYTHPRPAPIPPAGLDIRSPEKTHGWVDATGRPLSPSKSRARQKAARAPLQSLSSRNLDDDDDVLLPYLTDEQANRLLDEEDNTISGYGIRSS